MLKNYLVIALRNLVKHKGYSAINMAGLAVGMACCIFILAFILHETSYDRFHENSDRIFRLAAEADVGGRNIKVATAPAPMGPQLVGDFPEVVSSVRIKKQGDHLLEYGTRQYLEGGVLYADGSIFDIFSIRLVKGNPADILDAPCTMVMTEEAAEKYFGSEDPLGKTVKSIDTGEDFVVAGVMEALPPNTHMKFDMLVSFETLYQRSRYGLNWHNCNYQTYLLLAEGSNAVTFEAKLGGFVEKYLGEFMKAIGGEIRMFIQPITSIHLHSHFENELEANGDARYVYTFAAIGIFILLLACINFMNLSTARSTNRAREVGLRKVLGAEKGRLIGQFLFESLLMATLSMALALALVSVLKPFFQDMAGQEIDVSFIGNPLMLAGALAFVIFVGVAAGSYPALFLSGFRPAVILKGTLSRGGGSSTFRRALVVFQFAISIILIIGTGVIIGQLDYMRDMKLGFEKEQVVVLPLRDAELVSESGTLKQEIISLGAVSSASIAMMVPGESSFNTTMYMPEGWNEGETIMMQNITTDHDYLKTLGIELVAGRDFSRDRASDPGNVVMLNESAVRELGWDEPVGKKIYYPEGSDYFDAKGYYTIVGVIKDIHHRSLHHSVEPLMIRYSYDFAGRMAIRVETADIQGTLAAIGTIWKDFSGGRPFEYFFLDDYFDGLYRGEERLAGIFRIFTAFAVFIGCLGLFGLVSYAAEQRTREIGVRKVLGSSEGAIVVLLCREFIVLVLAANLLAWPVAYLAMKRWLEGFPFQARISPMVFVAAGLAAVAIAVLTVSYRAIRAACANPVDALRYE